MTDILIKFRKLQEQLSANVELDTSMQLTQATALDETAETLLVWGLSSEAVDAATEARGLLQHLALAAPDNPDYQRALEVSDRQLGEVLRVSGDFAEARDVYRQALGIGEALVGKDAANAQWQRNLLLCYSGIGLTAADQKDLPAALDAYEQAKVVALHLKEMNTTTADSDLAWAQGALDEVHRRMAGASQK